MTGISALVAPRCRDEQRRADVLVHPSLNGIDFVEYEWRPGPAHVLVVRMLKPLPDPPHSDPDGAYGLTTAPETVHLLGGTRVVNIRVLGVVDATFPSRRQRLEPGDKLLFYSDGIDAATFAGKPLGTESLLACAERHRALQIQDFIAALVQDLFGRDHQPDDLTLLGVELLPA